VDLVEGDRIMVGYNEGRQMRARVKMIWRSEQKGANYGRFACAFTYADNEDSENDGQAGTEWADEVYPLAAQVVVGYGSDERGFLVFLEWERAEEYVTKHNARVTDQAELEVEGMKSSPTFIGTTEDLAEYRESMIMGREAHIRPMILVPEWASVPTSEIC
jgi:hypothetical protein